MTEKIFKELIEKIIDGSLPNLTGTSVSLKQYQTVIDIIDNLQFGFDYSLFRHLLQQRITPYSDLMEVRNSPSVPNSFAYTSMV
ncbi:MAG: hypothetical protein JWR72_1611 [Flavisolibacter sp.]|nr:hypothetical protein [Flavisolibacter sp.]